ncbi:MAG: glutaminase A [Pseudobdellovibrionaceae bacterium]
MSKKSFSLKLSLLMLSSSLAWGQAPAAKAPQDNTLPSPEKIDQVLKEAYNKFKSEKEGKNADYIPALAKVPSTYFGIALVTTDGKVHTVGDVQQPFSIQSISKVITLAEVMQESGEQSVEKNIGVDATGQAFNSITAIEQYKGQEMNPLVNPGAITTTSMVQGKNPDDVWNKIINMHEAFAGRDLEVNQEVYRSESDTNQRNQAIGMLMHAYGRIKSDPKVATDLYTRQCSINVTAKDLSVMASTLANGGVNPVTGKKVVEQKNVEGILAVMSTAGLYDDSGKWLAKTGLPAKSGVGGGIMAVSPGKFGVAAFSPPLDAAGNSVRAQKAIAYISDALNGNPYDINPRVK